MLRSLPASSVLSEHSWTDASVATRFISSLWTQLNRCFGRYPLHQFSLNTAEPMLRSLPASAVLSEHSWTDASVATRFISSLWTQLNRCFGRYPLHQFSLNTAEPMLRSLPASAVLSEHSWTDASVATRFIGSPWTQLNRCFGRYPLHRFSLNTAEPMLRSLPASSVLPEHSWTDASVATRFIGSPWTQLNRCFGCYPLHRFSLNTAEPMLRLLPASSVLSEHSWTDASVATRFSSSLWTQLNRCFGRYPLQQFSLNTAEPMLRLLPASSVQCEHSFREVVMEPYSVWPAKNTPSVFKVIYSYKLRHSVLTKVNTHPPSWAGNSCLQGPPHNKNYADRKNEGHWSGFFVGHGELHREYRSVKEWGQHVRQIPCPTVRYGSLTLLSRLVRQWGCSLEGWWVRGSNLGEAFHCVVGSFSIQAGW